MTFDAATFFSSPKILLAPMAGVTDIAMRTLCLEHGADLCYTEMVSAMGLSYANERTNHLLALAPGEKQVNVQLFGHNPDVLAKEAASIEDTLQENLAFIDINMGCPVRKIVSKGDGSALMENPSLAAACVQAVVHAVSHPVSVKFRRGVAQGVETAPAFAETLQQAGASALAVHGRFAKQMYQGHSDNGVIARVKDRVSVPVIGNGDILSGQDALNMLHETHCDAVMIGRGACGNPWIFEEVKSALRGEDCSPVNALERIAMAKRHTLLLSQLNSKVLVRMRKQAMWYVAGLPGASVARGKFTSCTTLDDFNAVFDELLNHVSSKVV